jgi:hypothetical protein
MQTRDSNYPMEKIQNLISITELRRLLVAIVDANLSVSFRFRMLGEMWHPHFLKVLKVSDGGIVLHDESKNKSMIISDLSQVMQFELDGRLHHYIPNHHYDVTLKEVLS